mmetsp:Transcript_82954/g.164578  ORF Transcript_82954/g.164578 Transcript_82954/m.164578 type:complete len:216 (+) Transcript_82954:978-1625(+)
MWILGSPRLRAYSDAFWKNVSSSTPNDPALKVTSFAMRIMSRPDGYSGVASVHCHANTPMVFSPGSLRDCSISPWSLSTSSTLSKRPAGTDLWPPAARYAVHFVIRSSFIMPRNSGAYVDPAPRAICRLLRMRLSESTWMLFSIPSWTLNHLQGLPVAGSASSSKPEVLRYSPVIDEAVTRSVVSRPFWALPSPTLRTISSTFDFCSRVPCFATN